MSELNDLLARKKIKVKYHRPDSCNRCSGKNSYKITSYLDGVTMLECKTVCTVCGFTDYWAHGFFESSQDIECKCKTYTISC